MIPTLNDSCLIPFLLNELSNVSFTNMCDRVEYYLSVVNVRHQYSGLGYSCGCSW